MEISWCTRSSNGWHKWHYIPGVVPPWACSRAGYCLENYDTSTNTSTFTVITIPFKYIIWYLNCHHRQTHCTQIHHTTAAVVVGQPHAALNQRMLAVLAVSKSIQIVSFFSRSGWLVLGYFCQYLKGIEYWYPDRASRAASEVDERLYPHIWCWELVTKIW